MQMYHRLGFGLGMHFHHHSPVYGYGERIFRLRALQGISTGLFERCLV